MSVLRDFIADQRGDMAQHDVARLVAEGIVDPLEMIDVRHEERQRTVVAHAAAHFVDDPLLKEAVVVQVG